MANEAVVIGLLEDDRDQADLYRVWLEQAGFMVRAYAEVKVTGKVLQRGGLQAIHVVSIQGADGSASKDAGSYKRNEGLNPTPKKEQ